MEKQPVVQLEDGHTFMYLHICVFCVIKLTYVFTYFSCFKKEEGNYGLVFLNSHQSSPNPKSPIMPWS